MAHRVDGEMISYVEALAKLSLSADERRQAEADMARMLDYIDMLGELDTDGVEPMSCAVPCVNVFRDDVETEGMEREALLANAPGVKNGGIVVPRTVE